MRIIRKITAIILFIVFVSQPVFSAINTGLNSYDPWKDQEYINQIKTTITKEMGKEINDGSSIDQSTLDYLEDRIYYYLVSELDSADYFVENIEAVYVSKEYLEEVEYNSKANIYFGYSLYDIQSQFTGTRYIFTYDPDTNQTGVKEFKEYDDSYDRALRNVAIGTGVILICATVSVVTGGIGLSAVSMIFAASAKSGLILAASSGVISGVASGIVTGIKTKDFDEALKSAAVNGSESFKWGAIVGAITGGAREGINLKGATLNGLSMNEAALIQKESKYPIDVIKQFASKEQYDIFKQANLFPEVVNGKTALIRTIDLNYVDEFNRTNLQRMISGLAPLDPSTGNPYQLHHIGQKMDSTLAILTGAEHMKGGNDLILHEKNITSVIDRVVFAEQRRDFWKAFASLLSD